MIHKDANGKDYRYNLIPAMIQDGRILTFSDIFTYVPKTTIMKDLHWGPPRFRRTMADLAGVTIKDMNTMAQLFGVPLHVLCELAAGEGKGRHFSEN